MTHNVHFDKSTHNVQIGQIIIELHESMIKLDFGGTAGYQKYNHVLHSAHTTANFYMKTSILLK